MSFRKDFVIKMQKLQDLETHLCIFLMIFFKKKIIITCFKDKNPFLTCISSLKMGFQS